MSISESQLETWSHQGSITQSSNTYNTTKSVLEDEGTPYSSKQFKVFLQGSYGNDTNIFSESDVDIVIQTDSCFHHDLTSLSEEERSKFRDTFPDASYTHVDFKRDVLSTLRSRYGDAVKPGDKAINIAANGSRRKTDVIVATQFRRYHRFNGQRDQSYDEGICFFTASGARIANYPKQHSKNMTSKHQQTRGWLKPMVRVFKNLRGRLVSEGRVATGTAPSYYLEGLLYNVPADHFGNSYVESFLNCMRWIQSADKSKFVCANEQYFLLREDSPVTWRAAQCEEFLSAAAALWNRGL